MKYVVHQASEPVVIDIFHRKEFWFSCLLGLHILILVHVGQWYMYAFFAHKPPQIILNLRQSAALWYARAALAPPSIWIALRFRFQMEHWFRCMMVYSGFCVALAIAGSALESAVVPRIVEHGKIFTSASVDSPVVSDPVHLTRFQSAVIRGWPKLVYNMFTCWMLIAVVQGALYYEDLRRQQVQSMQLETQLATVSLRALRMQLNPHFLFNTLHAISTLIEEEPRVAEEMVLRLSHLLRSILDEEKPEIPLHQELGFLDDYIAIERVRFADRLTTRIEVDELVLDYAVPQLILQPLVENVIQHGIGRKAGCDSIEIRGYEHESLLHLEVRNQNSTLDRTSLNAGRVGIGLANTAMRLKTLYRERCSLDLCGLLPTGVVVVVTLPARRLNMLKDEPLTVGAP